MLDDPMHKSDESVRHELKVMAGPEYTVHRKHEPADLIG